MEIFLTILIFYLILAACMLISWGAVILISNFIDSRKKKKQ